jgi:hypothetical protein
LDGLSSLLSLLSYSLHLLGVLLELLLRDSSISSQETLSEEPIQDELFIVAARGSFGLVLFEVDSYLPDIGPVKSDL